jgi:hypothetical protein
MIRGGGVVLDFLHHLDGRDLEVERRSLRQIDEQRSVLGVAG